MIRIAILLILLLFTAGAAQAASSWGPWESRRSPGKEERREKNSPDLAPLRSGVRFFQRFISPVDGPRCPMYPTCSAYALEALEKHGPLLGVMMTVDRLFHEGDPREHTHPIRFGDRLRFRDPLENNDFWIQGDSSY